MKPGHIWKELNKLAESSNCKKRHVACIIVNGIGEVKGAGVNTHEDGVCDCVPGPSTATHAEIMAIESIAALEVQEPLYAYINHEPCNNCRSQLELVTREIKVNPTSERLDEDPVNPNHYSDIQGVPTIEFFKSATSEEGYKGYLQLTALKYIYRLDNKDQPLINAKKAQWFIEKLIKELE